MNSNHILPERRHGVRILTVRNLRNAAIVAAVLFVIISVASEMRDTTSGRYGRLYGKEVSKSASPLAKPTSVPDEVPTVAEQTYADPMRVESVNREAYLGVTQPPVAPAPRAATANVIPTAPVGQGDVAISGDPASGIQVTTSRGEKPVLSGGFGRP